VTARRSDERGFSLIEVLFTAAGFVVLTVGLIMLFNGFAAGASKQAGAHTASDAAWRIVAQLERDAQTAIAIFIPAQDVLGAANADGHEVDFYTKDASHTATFAAYRFDATALTITRYSYSKPGSTATVTQTATPATGFAATAILASALASDPSVAPMLGGYTPQDVSLQVGYAGVTAGNALVSVNVVTSAQNLTVRLLPGTLPSSFTVQGTYAPTPPPSNIDSAGNTYAQESLCTKPNGFDYNVGGTPGGTDYFNVRPSNCPTPTPEPHLIYGEYNCAAAPGAFISTDYSVSPPVDLFNYGGPLYAAKCQGGPASTPQPTDPNQIAFVTNCSQPAGVIGTDNTTVPPTTQYNKTDGCTNAPPAANTIYDWQYASTTPGCPFNAPAGPAQTCTLTAKLIRSDDGGLFWFPLVCIYDGTFDPSVPDEPHTYVLDPANESGCTSTQFAQLPVLYLNAADPRA